jgi:hypothetical protein
MARVGSDPEGACEHYFYSLLDALSFRRASVINDYIRPVRDRAPR